MAGLGVGEPADRRLDPRLIARLDADPITEERVRAELPRTFLSWLVGETVEGDPACPGSSAE